MGWAVAVPAITTLGGALIGANQSGKARKSQERANQQATYEAQRQREFEAQEAEKQRAVELAIAQWQAKIQEQNAIRSWQVQAPIAKTYGLNLSRPQLPPLVIPGSGSAGASTIPGYTPGSTTSTASLAQPNSLLALAQGRRAVADAEAPPAMGESPWGAGFGTLKSMYRRG